MERSGSGRRARELHLRGPLPTGLPVSGLRLSPAVIGSSERFICELLPHEMEREGLLTLPPTQT